MNKEQIVNEAPPTVAEVAEDLHLVLRSARVMLHELCHQPDNKISGIDREILSVLLEATEESLARAQRHFDELEQAHEVD